MGFPEDSLTVGEVVKRHLHPHWRVLLLPAFYTLVVLAMIITVWIVMADSFWGRVVLVLLALAGIAFAGRFAAWPLLLWQSRHFVFTNDRLILREGVGHRTQRDMPINRLNDVTVSQSFLDRAFGSGALIVGESGGARLENIPKVLEVQVLINQLIHESGHTRGADVPTLEGKLKQQAHPETEAPATVPTPRTPDTEATSDEAQPMVTAPAPDAAP